MTALQLADMVVELTRTLSQTRRERDAWRLVAIEGAHYGHERHVEHSRLEKRYYRLRKEQPGMDRQAFDRAADDAEVTALDDAERAA